MDTNERGMIQLDLWIVLIIGILAGFCAGSILVIEAQSSQDQDQETGQGQGQITQLQGGE